MRAPLAWIGVAVLGLGAALALSQGWLDGGGDPAPVAEPSATDLQDDERGEGANATSPRMLQGDASAATQPGGEAASATDPLRLAREALAKMLADAQAPAEAESDDATKARLRALTASLRTHGKRLAGGQAMLAMLRDETLAPETALRLGSALRLNTHAEVVSQLVLNATEAANANARAASVRALELRPSAVWFDAVQSAYTQDASPLVRDEAVGVLSRSLHDRQARAHHAQVRAALVSEMASPDAEQRLRTLTAIMQDPRPTAALADAVRARLGDDDERVKQEAKSALRVVERKLLK